MIVVFVCGYCGFSFGFSFCGGGGEWRFGVCVVYLSLVGWYGVGYEWGGVLGFSDFCRI